LNGTPDAPDHHFLRQQMKKIFYKIINPFRTAYRFVFRPRTKGVKCLIESNGRFLMIRNSYGHRQWTFPGGGIDRNELPERAAQREAQEEVGVQVANPVLLGEYFSARQYKRDTIYCFYSRVHTDYFKIDNDEVSEASWFAENDIPELRSGAVEKVLNLYRLKFKSQLVPQS
jgi:ADP-ribose pyrophosphatase YjhB (NUDIX family)